MIRTYTSRSFEKDTVVQWLALLNSQINWPVTFESVSGEKFEADIARFDFGELSLLSHALSPVVIERRGTEGERQARVFSFNFITQGKLVLEHHERRNVVAAGDMVLADSFMPSRLTFEETTHVITVRIPGNLLSAHIPHPERLCNRVLTRRHDFTDALRATLLSLLEMGRKGFSETLQEMSIQPFLGLLSFAFLANHGASLEDRSITRYRLGQIRQYIDENLTDGSLGPESIAARFRLSPRYLRKLFASEGDSLSKYIQRRRLEKTADRMANLLWKEQSITDICFDCGFNSAPHFTRAFKAQFGLTPKEYRKRATSHQEDVPASSHKGRTIMKRAAALLPCSMLLLLADSAFGAACGEMADIHSPGMTVVETRSFPAGAHALPGSGSSVDLPAHCRVSAVLRPSEESGIEMALWLPEEWNGRFLALGNGGWAGTISYGAMARGLQSGYAVASNDTGHKGGSAAFVLESEEKLVDFGHRAMHEMTVAAKALIAWRYEETPAYSYFQGCSTGGRQGLMEAQRYPEDFDAIIAGAPVNNMFALSAMQMEGYTSILADRSLYLPPDKVDLLHGAVLAACESEDGVADGFLNDPLACDFDPASLSCADAVDGEACLTPAQVDSVKRAYEPLLTANGTQVYPGHAKGFELAWRMPEEGTRPTTLQSDTFQYIVHRSSEWDWRRFDLDADFAGAMALAGDVHAVDSDLSGFKARGGKLLLYHGWNDPGPSPLNTLDYYESVLETMGRGQDDWLRVFLMPGMEHCRGGIGPDQADFLGAMEAWLETDTPPERITSVRLRDGAVDMTRPLCPYPQVPRWTGEGSANDAASYVCAADPD